MQIIAELEPTQRAVYCGSIGYWSLSGTLDLSIVIRTCLVLGRDVYFQVGGGIVADSDPEQEYRETLDKAGGPIPPLGPSSRWSTTTTRSATTWPPTGRERGGEPGHDAPTVPRRREMKA